MADERLELDRQKLALDRERFVFEQSRLLRERWAQEDSAVNQKLGWLMTTQAFIGAGYAYLVQQAAHGSGPSELKRIAAALPWFAALICVAMTVSILASQAVQDDIRKMGPAGAFGTKRLAIDLSRNTPLVLVFFFLTGWLALAAAK